MPKWGLVFLAVFRRDALIALTQPLSIITRLFNIAVAIGGFYYFSHLVDTRRFDRIEHHSATYFSYVVVNMIFTNLQATALQASAAAVRDDQINGTLEPILATQRATLPYVLANSVWPLMISLFEAMIALALGIALGIDIQSTNSLSLLTFILLSILTMLALSVISSALVIALKRLPPSGYLIGGAAALLAGTLFPTELLPWPFQILSKVLPLTHSLNGIRGAVMGQSLGELWADGLWLLVSTLLLLPAGIVALSLAVENGRVDGTLSHY